MGKGIIEGSIIIALVNNIVGLNMIMSPANASVDKYFIEKLN